MGARIGPAASWLLSWDSARPRYRECSRKPSCDRIGWIATWPATILNLIGDQPQQIFPIPSLAQLWQQPGVDPGWPNPISELHRYIYQPHEYPAYSGWLKAIVAPRWQLVVSEKMSPELFDWTADPDEQHNLASDPTNSAQADQLNTELWSEVEPSGAGTKVESAIPDNKNSGEAVSR